MKWENCYNKLQQLKMTNCLIFFLIYIAMTLDNIEQLEATIDRLLASHERIKTEKEAVEKRLQQKESEWHHLKGQLRQYERERVELREKLDRILGQVASLDLSES